jgi:GTP-binding protein
MLPAVAIVGRPNVGKSTLFNCLTGSRDALVADRPGLTRDRQYGLCRRGSKPFIAIDTGGFGESDDAVALLATEQARRAEEESDLLVLVTDARTGRNGLDEKLAARLRRYHKPVIVAVNKTDGMDPDVAAGDFHELGLGVPHPIAAAHGRGITALIDELCRQLPPTIAVAPATDPGIVMAVVGRPNVGKSTFINSLLGDERVITHDAPGTTRDSIHIPFERRGRGYTIIDTAGVRRRARVDDAIEKFSVIKTLQAIEACQVAVVLLDAGEGVGEQDLRLIAMVTDAGRALVIGVNKWDKVSQSERRRVRASIARELRFIDFAAPLYLSALKALGLGKVLSSVDRAFESAARKLSTPALTRILAQAIEKHPPPVTSGRRIKLRFAHQGGVHPPVIVVHGNQTGAVPEAYRRYLARAFREALDLPGTPIRIEFKTGRNPFEGRRNEPTARQLRHRKRLRRHLKRSR